METPRPDRVKMIKNSDQDITRRILAGEKELFEILMRRYNQTLYRVIRSYISREDDVEDIMQNVYIKAYLKLEQFKGEASFSTWLIRIGINEALQHIRKSRQNQGVFEQITALNNMVSLPDTKQMNPEKHVINHEMRLLIEKAIDCLPEKYRIIFLLHEVEGLEYQAIATCLRIKDNNVKIRIHRARKLLKELLYQMSSDRSVFEFGNHRCDKVVRYVMNEI